MGRLPVASLLAVVVTVGVAAAQESAEPSSVRLDFAWAPGLQASVSSTRTRTRVAEERSTRSATSRYTLRVAPQGENLRIHFADPSFELEDGGAPLSGPAQAQIVAGLADLMPDYVVTRSGDFVGIHDLPSFRAKLRELLEKLLAEKLEPERLEQIEALLTSESFLNSRAAEEWNAVVGGWAGLELELGAEYTHSLKEPVQVLPGEQILMNFVVSARRLVPCRRGGAERRCAELEMRSSSDPEDTKRILETFLSRLGATGLPPMPIFRSLEVENVIRVVSEPDGLVPHRWELNRTFRGVVSAEGQEHPVEQVDRTQVSYAYP